MSDVNVRCPVSVTGMCLQMVEGFAPCDDIAECEYAPNDDAVWEADANYHSYLLVFAPDLPITDNYGDSSGRDSHAP